MVYASRFVRVGSRWTVASLCVLSLLILVPCSAQSQMLPNLNGWSSPNLWGGKSRLFGGAWLSGIGIGDVSAGLFYGSGTFKVTHLIQPGDAGTFGVVPGRRAFDGFEHQRKTDLTDAYISLKCGLESQGRNVFSLAYETNFGCTKTWKQTTSAGTGGFHTAKPHPFGRTTMAVLYLPDDTEGQILLDNRNRFTDVEALAAFPAFRNVSFLLGYKYAQRNSRLDPYSAHTPGRPLGQLPGLTNWEWLYAFPGTTGFTMGQFFKYQGLLLGLRLSDFAPVMGQRGLFFEVLFAPYLVGRYEFQWDADYYRTGTTTFVTGSQTTDASGLKRYFFETRAGGEFNLFSQARLKVSGSYSYLEMNGSTPQIQKADLHNLALPPTSIDQTAEESVTITQQFWTIGGSLVLPF